MRSNATLRRLTEGMPALGVVCTTGSSLVAQSLSQAGFDFVLVDCQHGAWELNEAMDAFAKISLGPATPMARVHRNDFYDIGRLLDRGALGIVVPMVNTRAEAEAAAFAMRYPPRGGRSMGAFSVDYYEAPNYVRWADDQVFLAVQIETATGLENVDEIMAVEGVDGCWIGPNDLAATMGLDLSEAGDRRRHEEAIMRVLAACRHAGKIPGIYGGDDPAYWIEKGFLFVTTTTDLVIIDRAMRDLVRRVRGE
ncbi:MAG: 2-dehydro-3-deoxyglucarate aldolase [Anaerolineae bacterium]|nr:2-dehydro-3-deoxyglucarate aldolase [Anaerolineae bacterium]